MQTTLLFGIILLFAVTVSAQHQPTFGIYAGQSFSQFKFKWEDLTSKYDFLVGPQAGFVVDIPVCKHISMQPGLAYVQKGYTDKSDENGYSYKDVLRLHEIELPLSILYNTRGPKGNFFFGVGPTLAFTISGVDRLELNGEKDKTTLKIGNSETEDDIRGLDFGAQAIMGYEFRKPFFVAVNYNLGISNRVPGKGSDYGSAHADYLGVRFGYFFRRR